MIALHTRLLAMVLCCAGLWAAPATPRALPELGDAAPSWKLRDADGERLRFPRDLDGRPALLVFWASWCPYCKALLPELAALANEAGARDVAFLAINFAEQGEPAAGASSTHAGLRVFQRGDAVAERYGVDKVPALFLVDAGRIVYRLDYPPSEHPASRAGHGAEQARLLADWWRERVRAAIAALPAHAPQ